MSREGDQRQTAELYSDNFELGLELCMSVHYDLLTCAWSEAGNGYDSGQDAEMIWGEMKWCKKIDRSDDLQCGDPPNSDLYKLLLLLFYLLPLSI